MANIENLAKFIADLTVGIARFISLVNLLVTDKSLNPFNTLKKAKAMMDKWSAEDAKKNEKQQTNAIKSTSKVLKLNKDIAKVQKDTAKLAVLQGIFDPQQAAILAALQGKITDEERKRLELMLAMEQGNVNEAQKLANELANAQGKTSILATYLRTLPDARNPFESWGEYLKALEEQIRRMIGATPQGGNGGGGNQPLISTNVPNGYAGPGSSAWQERQSYMTPTTNVVVTVEGGDELTTLMRYKIAEASSSGSGVNWSQSVGAYDR